MSFNILYVENRNKDWEKLEKAVNEWSDNSEGEPLVIDRASSPEELKRLLNLKFDVILADVYFPDPSSTDRDGVNKLGEIIEYVREWSASHDYGRSIPIIAYTGLGKKALLRCLEYKDKLYDIWDKFSASPDYAAWQLSKLSKEIARIRPDATIQRKIREMESGAPWHKQVVEMTRRYDEGLTELDQVERVKGVIESIALKFGEGPICKQLWQAMIDWEALSRATSLKVRGHARHVINVFWLGYYLLHHKDLEQVFIKSWEQLLERRLNTGEVKDVAPLEALSNAWFYAGLFHDVGGCIEKLHQVHEFQNKFVNLFGDIAPKVTYEPVSETRFLDKADDWLHEFDKPLRGEIEKWVRKSVEKKEPDQGVVAAIHLRDRIKEGKQAFYIKEATRAMSLHNLFPKLDLGEKTLPISWENEPLVCLLLLCDQIQTWDRERGDSTFKDDHPSRAELSALSVEVDGAGRPKVSMTIDYISPAHLMHAPEVYKRVKYGLDEILRDHPHHALDKIAKPWPFSLKADCTLSGDPLDTSFSF